MKATARKYRQAPRKELTPLTLDNFASLDTLQKLAGFGEVVEASSTGILLHFKRDDFIEKDLRSTLNIDFLVGQNVYFTIHEMGLEISGTVARTKFMGKKGFQVAVDYSKDAPEYWRECLMDLLPE
ncbi:MAG: hypothetical protein A2622_04475 [Bdellovibrionales bacterium RIFCSPHIGHO2_01_FULL_40_29]|nr:MAG: hypothetical protein A2622_04475 [Bdellovibrionales bacterium RIFCSPHIGHO2_01_FULL_40_29]OFZ34810.1 MAG: hypothetical protein A3D17_10900 [Bdellovibrionales bacterium RIFCSPHIGHO2_02_FULL_40_15]